MTVQCSYSLDNCNFAVVMPSIDSSPKIMLVTGGQRSGKSEFAESIALSHSPRPCYIATAQILDDEMQRRVDAHRARRADRWNTVEEPLHLGSVPVSGVGLVDCLTLWATNALFACDENIDAALNILTDELGLLLDKDWECLVFVTNEIGLGGVSPDPLARKFADLQGLLNRHVASIATDVYFVVSGIPLKIK